MGDCGSKIRILVYSSRLTSSNGHFHRYVCKSRNHGLINYSSSKERLALHRWYMQIPFPNPFVPILCIIS